MIHLTTFDTPYVIFDLFIQKTLLRIKTKRNFEVEKTQPFNSHFSGSVMVGFFRSEKLRLHLHNAIVESSLIKVCPN